MIWMDDGAGYHTTPKTTAAYRRRVGLFCMDWLVSSVHRSQPDRKPPVTDHQSTSQLPPRLPISFRRINKRDYQGGVGEVN